MLIGLIVILVVLAVPAVALAVRLRRGEQPPGGSFGSQLGRGDEDWGPKP